MKIDFEIDPSKEILVANVIVKKEDLHTNKFYLNRDFKVEQIICDGIEVPIVIERFQIEQLDNYQVCKYIVPLFEHEVTITYQGALTGQTGCCPYVRERITPEFTLLRWETFCYPMFLGDAEDALHQYLCEEDSSEMILAVKVPKEYTVVATGNTIHYKEDEMKRCWTIKVETNNINIAIAKYIKKLLEVGEFYFFKDNEQIALLQTNIGKIHKYMNRTFGERRMVSDIKYITIPSGFGSYALDETVFIEESSYSSSKEMRQIIHEFIHLGWNVKADRATQKIRFFDEAFTSYFELRSMKYLLNNEQYMELLEEYKDSYKRTKKHLNQDIPIIDFGKYDYGNLNYTIGAFCLMELCEYLGEEVFDQITKVFLEKYREIPIDLDTFCREYIQLSKKDGLERFFEEWIYTTKAHKKYLL